MMTPSERSPRKLSIAFVASNFALLCGSHSLLLVPSVHSSLRVSQVVHGRFLVARVVSGNFRIVGRVPPGLMLENCYSPE
jgi:hypothetical protein